MRRPLTVGVEEEYFAVDPTTRRLVDGAPAVLRSARLVEGDAGRGRFGDELRLCMVEGRTGICRELGELRAELGEVRDVLVAAGREEGVEIAAAGTFPGTDWRTLGFTPKPRYEHVASSYAQLAQEHLICACHVHVGVDGRDAAI